MTAFIKASAGLSPFAVPSALWTFAPHDFAARSIVAATATSRANLSLLATAKIPARRARSSLSAAKERWLVREVASAADTGVHVP